MRVILTSLAAVSIVGALSAQTPIGPFSGTIQEGFETQSTGSFDPCIQGRVFGSTADLCTPGGSGAHITGGWSFACNIQERSGVQLFGAGGATAGGGIEYTFDSAPSRFGGYFGMNHTGGPDFTVTFFAGATMVGSPTNLAMQNDCSWNWFGWDLTGTGIDRVHFATNHSSTGYLMMDDMEVDSVSGPCTTVYCTPKINSLGCTPSISTDAGCPVPGTPFFVNVSGIINNKAGIIFYGSGSNGLPFQGGFLCVNPPISRTAVQTSGGNPPPNDCSGTMSIDFDALGLGAGPWYFQGWSRDPNSPSTTSLTEGVMIP